MINGYIWTIYDSVVALEKQIEDGKTECDKYSKALLHELPARLISCSNSIPE